MIKFGLADFLTKQALRISQYGGAITHDRVPPLLPIGTPNRNPPYVRKVDIHNGGTDGSATPVTYTLAESDPNGEYDLYLQSIILVIVDGTVSYSKYGAIAELPVGVDIYSSIGGEINYLGEKIKTGGEALVWAGFDEFFASDPATIANFIGNNSGLLAVFDLGFIQNGGDVPGLRIGRGTKDGLYCTINDNLTQLTDHYIFVKGIKLYE